MSKPPTTDNAGVSCSQETMTSRRNEHARRKELKKPRSLISKSQIYKYQGK